MPLLRQSYAGPFLPCIHQLHGRVLVLLSPCALTWPLHLLGRFALMPSCLAWLKRTRWFVLHYHQCLAARHCKCTHSKRVKCECVLTWPLHLRECVPRCFSAWHCSGARAGFFLGDGAGVGKGRQIAASIKEYWLRRPMGKRRVLWISTSADLRCV